MGDKYNDFFKKNANYNGGVFEFYEDTHDKNGTYRPLPTGYNNFDSGKQLKKIPPINAEIMPNINLDSSASMPTMHTYGVPLPNDTQKVVPRNYQNVVVYEPKTPEEVQSLISFLKRKEPAIVDLNKLDVNLAQRILDYLSGAIYALNGDVIKINSTSNIFLLSPEGVMVSTSKSING